MNDFLFYSEVNIINPSCLHHRLVPEHILFMPSSLTSRRRHGKGQINAEIPHFTKGNFPLVIIVRIIILNLHRHGSKKVHVSSSYSTLQNEKTIKVIINRFINRN